MSVLRDTLDRRLRRGLIHGDLRSVWRSPSLGDLWERLWFQKVGVEALGVFRIAFGLMWLQIFLVMYPNWLRFYGPQGVVPIDVINHPLYSSARYSIFALARTDATAMLFYGLALVTALGLTIGWQTRLWTVLLYVLVISMINRATIVTHGEDLVSRILLLYAIFAPLGEHYSVDSWLRRRKAARKGEIYTPRKHPVWSLRLMQISLAFVYLFSLPAKPLDDFAWVDGSAIYYVMVSSNWGRIRHLAPLFYGFGPSHLMTYGTLLVEGAFPLLVWFKALRKYILVAIAGLHLGVLLTVNHVINFNLVMLVGFILFVPGESIAGGVARVRKKNPLKDRV